jgi:hypothetical protein
MTVTAEQMAAVPASFVQRVAYVESGLDPHAHARTSSAAGLFQFLTGTWADIMARAPELDLAVGGETDPVQAERAFRWLAASNTAYFETALNRTPTNGDLYLCHFLGARSAVAVCGAAGDTTLKMALGPSIYSGVAGANAFLAGWTCEELGAWADQKMAEPAPPASASPAPASAPTSDADALNQAELNKLA